MNLSLRKIDWFLLTAVLFLIGLGIIVLFSIDVTAVEAETDFRVWKQIIYAVVGLIVMLVLANTDYHMLERFAGLIYFASLGLLVLVPLFGEVVLGARRWIDLGFIQFQPSELAKIALILLLGRLFSKRYDNSAKPGVIMLSLFYTALPIGLIVLQPDLGTAIAFVFIWLIMLINTKLPIRYALIGLLVMAASIPLIIPNLAPYQQQRISTFLNPAADPQGSGYNINQSLIAIGSGEITGKGLSAGSQSQLNFLPSQHTDFIFAVVSEKLGFIGGALVIIAFGIVLIRALAIAWRATDRFGMFLATGITALLFFHVVINLGMNQGLLPATGLPLPFLSYGGTHLIITMAMVGMLLSVYARGRGLDFSQ